MYSILVFSQETSNQSFEGNTYSHIVDQALNFLPDANCTKVHIKLLAESFAEKFYSFDYCLKKPGKHNIIFTIISETVSESNSRNSSFLIAELTTST